MFDFLSKSITIYYHLLNKYKSLLFALDATRRKKFIKIHKDRAVLLLSNLQAESFSLGPRKLSSCHINEIQPTRQWRASILSGFFQSRASLTSVFNCPFPNFLYDPWQQGIREHLWFLAKEITQFVHISTTLNK